MVADGAERTQDGVATVARTREAFEAIGAAVEDMSARVGEIAASAQSLATTGEELNELVRRLKVTA